MKFNSVKSAWLQFTARCSRSDCYLLRELPKPGEETFLATVPMTYPGSLKSLFRPRESRQMFWSRRFSGCGTAVINCRSSLSKSCAMLCVFPAFPERPRQQPAAPRERAVQDPAAAAGKVHRRALVSSVPPRPRPWLSAPALPGTGVRTDVACTAAGNDWPTMGL